MNISSHSYKHQEVVKGGYGPFELCDHKFLIVYTKCNSFLTTSSCFSHRVLNWIWPLICRSNTLLTTNKPARSNGPVCLSIKVLSTDSKTNLFSITKPKLTGFICTVKLHTNCWCSNVCDYYTKPVKFK